MNSPGATWHILPNSTELAQSLAQSLQVNSVRCLDTQAGILIGLAGGSTPMAAYAEFAQLSLPWSRIALSLIDERFVPIFDAQSNEGHLASVFAAVKPQLAAWYGLMHTAMPIAQAAYYANQRIQALQQAMDMVVIGMGVDGHIASLFSDSVDYPDAMCLNNTNAVLPIRFSAEAAKAERLSFTLAELLKAKKILICITGDEKRRVLEDSLDGSKPEYAMAQLLKYYTRSVDIFWSPACL
jgi:6-phosphogluconolactonase